MLVALLVIIAVVLLLYHHVTKNNSYWKKRNIAGPAPTFFFGNIKDLAFRMRSTKDIYKEICDRYPDEKLIGIFRMRSPDLLINDVEIIKHILIKDFDNFADRDVDYSEEGLGSNLFAANGNTWRTLRHHFTPFFTSGKLKKMTHLILERGAKLVDYVDKITRDQPIQEVHGIFKKFTQSCIAACAFGLDIDIFDKPIEILEELEPKIFINSYRSELEMMYPGILKRLKLSLLSRDVTTFFCNLTKDVIAQRNGRPSNRNDFVDLMLGLRKTKSTSFPTKESKTSIDMTDDIIAGQMFIMYSAGYQTSALTVSFMLYYLAINPDIQEKVVAEIKLVLQNYNGKLTYEAVFDMKYMGQVFDETLRLHPSGDTIRRRSRAAYRVPGTDLIVKKGQIFIIPVPVIHMNPRHYANPEVFDPERFSSENVSSRHSCAYLPFGLGPRYCIGMRFALLQSRIGMARLLSAFRVEPCARTPRRFQYKPSFLLHPVGGIPLKLVRRL